MKNLLLACCFLFCNVFAAQCQNNCPIFPSPTIKHFKTSKRFLSGYFYLVNGGNIRLSAPIIGTGYWGFGVEAGFGQHISIGGAVGGGGFLWQRFFDNQSFINYYEQLNLNYYFNSIAQGSGIGIDAIRQSDLFSSPIYKINYLYAIANRKKTYSTIFSIGTGMNKERDFFVGGNVQFCLRFL
jgi:hypothetical protein